jgi:hypothetical protein
MNRINLNGLKWENEIDIFKNNDINIGLSYLSNFGLFFIVYIFTFPGFYLFFYEESWFEKYFIFDNFIWITLWSILLIHFVSLFKTRLNIYNLNFTERGSESKSKKFTYLNNSYVFTVATLTWLNIAIVIITVWVYYIVTPDLIRESFEWFDRLSIFRNWFIYWWYMNVLMWSLLLLSSRALKEKINSFKNEENKIIEDEEE